MSYNIMSRGHETQDRKTTYEKETKMADFVQNSTVKSAVRKFANPIADVATFKTIVQSVITNNLFSCALQFSVNPN